jgi:hypothetical protein
LVTDLLFLSDEFANVVSVGNIVKHFRSNSPDEFQVCGPSAAKAFEFCVTGNMYSANAPESVPLNRSFDQCLLHSNICWVSSKVPVISVLY